MPIPYIDRVSIHALMQIHVYTITSLHHVPSIQIYDHFFRIQDRIAPVLQIKSKNALVFERIRNSIELRFKD